MTEDWTVHGVITKDETAREGGGKEKESETEGID